MKTLIAALLLASLSAPAAMAMEGTMDTFVGVDTFTTPAPGIDDLGRRSGRCPNKGAFVAREGSTCGGV
jgi:hypothetical protein